MGMELEAFFGLNKSEHAAAIHRMSLEELYRLERHLMISERASHYGIYLSFGLALHTLGHSLLHAPIALRKEVVAADLLHMVKNELNSRSKTTHTLRGRDKFISLCAAVTADIFSDSIDEFFGGGGAFTPADFAVGEVADKSGEDVVTGFWDHVDKKMKQQKGR